MHQRKLLLIVFSALLSASTVPGQTMNSTGEYTSNMHTVSRFSAKDFAPDGDLTKKVWRSAKRVTFEHDMSGQHQYPQAATRVASVWTDAYIYFAFECKYSTLNIFEGEDVTKERWELWTRDVAEVFLNPQPERVPHYYEFEVSPNNMWIDLEIDKTKTPFNDAKWDSHFEHATRIDAKKHVWTVEMRIPLASMNVTAVKPGAEWRVNFYRADGPGEDPQRRFMCWSTIPEGKTFHVPDRFGTIKLVK